MTSVQIALGEDDALILFEVLNRLSEDSVCSGPERQTIDAVICALESVLEAPFDKSYDARIDQILADRKQPAPPEEA